MGDGFGDVDDYVNRLYLSGELDTEHPINLFSIIQRLKLERLCWSLHTAVILKSK